MTARDNFDIRKELEEIFNTHPRNQHALMRSLEDFGRRCQDSILNKAIEIADSEGDCWDISDKLRKLKTPGVKP